jgi:hypothetical protein
MPTDEFPPGEQVPVGPDQSQGYLVEIKVLADGTFQVKQETMQIEPEEAAAAGEETGENFDNLGDALKEVIRIVRDNPVGESEQANFEAGAGIAPRGGPTAPPMAGSSSRGY